MQTIAVDDPNRTETLINYNWKSASQEWECYAETIARYRGDLIPGVDAWFIVESTDSELDSSVNRLVVKRSVVANMTVEDGEFVYHKKDSYFVTDASGNRVEIPSEDLTEHYETYTPEDGLLGCFPNYKRTLRYLRGYSGNIFVGGELVETLCRYRTLIREMLTYEESGEIYQRNKWEWTRDVMERATRSSQYLAMQGEDYREISRETYEYVDDTRVVKSKMFWRDVDENGALVFSEGVAYEYDKSVAADEVIGFFWAFPETSGFAVVKAIQKYGDGSEQETVFTYADRSEMVGVENVVADHAEVDESLPAEIFTLDGVKVGEFASPRAAGLPSGLHIERRGTSTRKIIL